MRNQEDVDKFCVLVGQQKVVKLLHFIVSLALYSQSSPARDQRQNPNCAVGDSSGQCVTDQRFESLSALYARLIEV